MGAAMFSRLMPVEGHFFELFVEHADEIVKASRELVTLMTEFNDLERRSYTIETIEKRADRIAHAAIDLLHKTFITPIDRDDIHRLVTRMDDIIDLMEDAAHSVHLYDVRAVTPEARRLAELGAACATKVREAVQLLSNMEHARQIIAICGDIDKLESEADHVMRSAMAKLFRDEPDVRQVIKMRSIYELLEEVTDRSQDVANIIEGIVIENA
jgi:predicted phosphate transport protein (TIGR00153 family)